MDLDYKILKSIISNKTIGIEFSYNFNHELFIPELKPFAKLVIEYIKAYKTIPTKNVLLRKYDDEEFQDIINEYWDEIEGFEYDVQEYNFDLQQLKDRFAADSLKNIRDKLEDEVFIESETKEAIKYVNLSMQNLNVVKQGRSFTQKTTKEYVDQFRQEYQANKEFLEKHGKTAGIKTYYSVIDGLTDGFNPSELIILGGETGSGKSMFLSNLATQIWLQGHDMYSVDHENGYNVLYFSLEMPYDRCFARYLARLAEVPQNGIIKGSLKSEDEERVEKALEFIENYPFSFEIVDIPRGVTIEEIELRYNDALHKYQPDVVIVDYMGLMRDPANAKEQDWLRLSSIAASLHEFSRAYNVVLLTAVQLTDIKRKEGKKDEESRVGLHRVGRSSQIMHHANVSIQIETRSNEKNYGDLKYHFTKNRDNPLGHGNLRKNFAQSSLFDIEVDNGGINEDISNKLPAILNSG